MAAKVEIRGVSKSYGNDGRSGVVHALHEISLVIGDGEFISLVGPSGCGKSTLLHIIAGFEPASSGEVRLDGRPIHGPGADRGVVFQDYALFPWKTVLQNVAFGPELRGIRYPESLAIAREHVTLVGLSGFESRYPHELSGGMKQRCALARCVVNNPAVLLMDEPLAAIDALTRYGLQTEIRRICGADGPWGPKTVLYVTHSAEEAVFLSDRIVLMTPRPGRVLKVIDVGLGCSRDASTRQRPEYQKLCGEIWETLKDHIIVAAGNERLCEP